MLLLEEGFSRGVFELIESELGVLRPNLEILDDLGDGGVDWRGR